jgi:dolichyl-phosphate-mannose--protein O-mannosyl transferase
MFWILCAFGFLVIDRDRSRLALARKVDRAPDRSSFGPAIMHWWRIPAGICLGMACATKWTGVFYIAAFGLLILLWDMGARRAARVRSPILGTVVLEAGPAFLSIVVVATLTYLSSWWGWIFRPGGWGRGQVASNPFVRPFEAMPDLWKYHKEIWNFHTGLEAKHPYQSWPWDWPILHRPVAFFYTQPSSGCGSDRCSREILGIGTPALWWGALAALLVMVYIWAVHRDWRAGAVLLSYLAGLLPWVPSALGHRTMFLFYATPMLPFMVLAIVLTLGLVIGPQREVGGRRLLGAIGAGAFMLIVLANFAYFYPILAAKVITYDDWRNHMWFQSWI